MYQVLNKSVIPKKKKTPSATVSAPQLAMFPTINHADLDALVPETKEMKSENATLPTNFQLAAFEDNDAEGDDWLLQFLKDNPFEEQEKENVAVNAPEKESPPANNKQPPATKIESTSNNTIANVSTNIPVMPKMFFPNSKVVINYNIYNKK